jgi:hypothetical protein
MANRDHQPRWEPAVLAAALAIAGTLFLFDHLGATLLSHLLSWSSLLHSSPAALASVAAALVWAEQESQHDPTSAQAISDTKEGQS